MKSLESVKSPIACKYPFHVLETLRFKDFWRLSKVPEKASIQAFKYPLLRLFVGFKNARRDSSVLFRIRDVSYVDALFGNVSNCPDSAWMGQKFSFPIGKSSFDIVRMGEQIIF